MQNDPDVTALHDALDLIPGPARPILRPLLAGPDGLSMVPPALVAALGDALGLGTAGVLGHLVPLAAQYAMAPISGYAAGAVALGLSGAAYLGANVEVPGTSLASAVHAEQSAIHNAWLHGEEGVGLLAVSAAPCGHCRQFLWEVATARTLQVVIRGEPPVALASLLPNAFGPADLGVRAGLMASPAQRLTLPLEDTDPLVAAALEAAERSYAPYSHGLAGAALLTSSGAIVAGRYAENAAFNPSLSPLPAAVAMWRLREGAARSIQRAVLVAVAGPVDLRAASQQVLATLSTAQLEVHTVPREAPEPR